MARKRTPRLRDLAPAPYNPRDISPEARDGLASSLDEFGDIAGITWNQRTGNLVAGHQRLNALREDHGTKLRMSGGVIRTPDGDTFRVRVVDWSPEKERAANIVANSPLLAGVFTGGVADLFDELDMDGDIMDALRLDELRDLLTDPSEADDLAAALGALPSGDHTGFQQMTFTLSDAQVLVVAAALKRSKGAGDFDETENGNSNSNALVRIAEAFDG